MFQGNARHSGQSPYTGPSSSVLKWSFHLDGLPGSPVIAADGTVYVPTGMLNRDTKGSLYAVNPDGTQRWKCDLPGLPSSTAPAVASDGTIYVHMNGAEGNQVAIELLCAINPDGSLKWAFKPNGDLGMFTSPVQSSPAIGSDGTIYVGSMNTCLFAINPTGTQKWAVSPSASSITASPAVGPDGTVYCIDAASTLAAYNPDGSQKWLLQADAVSGGDGSPSIGPDGTVYVAVSGSSHLRAVSPAGVVKWSYPVGGLCRSTPAFAADGTVYVNDNGLYALRPDGSLRWKYRGDTLFSSVSPVVGANGVIYWRESWSFFGVNPDGTTRWSMGIPSPDSSGVDPSPAIGRDGTLYVPQPDVFDAGNQYLKAYAKVSPGTVTLKLSGLRSGSIRLGRSVSAKGKVTPVDGAPKVLCSVQKKSGAKWVRVKTASRTIDAGGAYRWAYRPARKGSYRMRATIAKTATTLAGASPWRSFRVK